VWDLLRRVEDWWLESNPEHESLEVLSDGPLREGSRIRIRESIAGIPGTAEGVVTKYRPGRSVTWEAPEAKYRLYGVPLEVSEGVEWSVDPLSEGRSRLSARVWAEFPSGVGGRILEWVFRRVLHGVEKDREHARTELRYLKKRLGPITGSGSHSTPAHPP
jgi:hypothetical protein